MSTWYGERAEVYDQDYKVTVLSVGTTQLEAKIGSVRDEKRQLVVLYNSSSNTVYYGQNGVTPTSGMPLRRKQEVAISLGDVPIYLISSYGNNNVILQEFY